MTTAFEDLQVEEVLQEAELLQKAVTSYEEFFARPVPPRPRMRGGLPVAGRNLLRRCPEITQRRVDTLLHFENNFPQGGDFSFLIGPAGQIVEAELDRLLAQPARSLAGSLVEVLRQEKKKGPAETLERWEAGQLPTMIGVQGSILLAVRYGHRLQVPVILAFLDQHFLPEYTVSLSHDAPLLSALNRLRELRNQACHAKVPLTDTDHATFARLSVGQSRFWAWDKKGPETEAVGETAVLHHHWSKTRLRSEDVTT